MHIYFFYLDFQKECERGFSLLFQALNAALHEIKLIVSAIKTYSYAQTYMLT